jgi:RNA polymerase sigma-70 factor (ECF subfamily)
VVSSNRHRHLESLLGRLYGYAMCLCGEPEGAAGLVQQGATQAMATRRVPSDASEYRVWLFRIVRLLFIERTRSLPVRAGDTEQAGAPDHAVAAWPADERLINVITVRQQLAALSDHDRDIIGLIDVGGLSYAEAEAVLDAPPGTVNARISRARAALMRGVMSGNVRLLHLERQR